MNVPKLGIESIDKEHRDILIFASQIKHDKDDINKIILCFLDIIQYHFFHEETFMQEVHYEGLLYVQHLEEHRRLRFFFLENLLSLQRVIEDKEKIEKTIQYFIDELVHHMNTYDVTLAEWLGSKKEN